MTKAVHDVEASPHFREILWVLHGERRVALTTGASRILGYIFRGEGADLELTKQAFVIRFAWHPARHRYRLENAASVVSAVLSLCGVTSVDGPTTATIRASAIPHALQWRSRNWGFSDQNVWLFPGSTLRIMVRSAADQSQPDVNVPPAPIDYVRQYVRLVHPLACPRCKHVSTEFRVLQTSSWVCPICGVSFPADDYQQVR